MSRAIRGVLIALHGFVAVTAVAGGATLVAATLAGSTSSVLVPNTRYLEGSPFSSYLVPGILLAAVVGGMQVLALVLLLRRSRGAMVASVAAAMGLHIWVFVELIVIPFSFLQVVYFAAALGELGLALLALGLLRFRMPRDSRMA